MINGKKNWFISEGKKILNFPFTFVFFISFPPSCFLCLVSKTTWANIAKLSHKGHPLHLTKGRILQLDGAAKLSDTQPSFTHMRCKGWWEEKKKKKRLFLFEPEFEPWGQTHYSTMKEVFHAITEQIDMDEMLAVVEDLNSNVSSFVKKEKKKKLWELKAFFTPSMTPWHDGYQSDTGHKNSSL